VFRRAICGEQSRGYWQVFANLAYRVSGPVADVAAPGLVKRLEIERVGGHVVPAYADQFSHQSATVTTSTPDCRTHQVKRFKASSRLTVSPH
jgi:hypothetical protein